MQAVDVINGGAGIDTLNIVAFDGVRLPTISNLEIINASSIADLELDVSKVSGLTNLNVTKTVGYVDVTASAATNVNVTVDGLTTTWVEVMGGKDVTVTLINSISDIDIGGSASNAPVGAVTISATGAEASNANTPIIMAQIDVEGGKTVNVTQKATSDASALVADVSAVTHYQGNVGITAGVLTTDVTVKQDANVTAAAGIVAVAGVMPVTSVKFGAMLSGQTAQIGSLIITAAKDLTAAQAATAFTNLTATGDTQGSGIDGNGVYTGSFSGWTTGAASGDTVVFTGNTAAPSTLTVGGDVLPTATPTTTGVTAVAAVAAKLGVTAGFVNIFGAAALKTVSVDGSNGAAIINNTGNKALDTINLANGAGAYIESAATTLALSLDKVAGNVEFAAALTTLNIKSTGNNTIGTLLAAATESLNVSGTGTLSATSPSSLANTKAIKVTETAGLNLTGATLTSLTSVDTTGTTGTTGTVTLTINSTQTTYAGGAGVDAVTLSNATTATKALDLGAGNDTLTLATGTAVPTAVLKGGAGDDTLSLVAADAVTLSASTAFAAKLEGFERLQVTGATGAQTIDMGKLGFTNHVTVAGVAASGMLTLTDLASNATVVLTANATGGGITANIKDAATGTADVLNLSMTTAANLNGDTLTAANVEAVNINTAVAGASLTLVADKATAVTVTGTGALNLTTTNSKLITSIDGSAMTGALTATSTNTTAATTIKGGAGNDSLTAATGTTADMLLGGAGNDTLTANAGLSTLTGGAGNDTFVINTASLNVNSYATITDFAAGDLLRISGANSFAPAKVVLGATAVFQDFANAAINTLGIEGAGWFQFGGDTYVVSDKGVDGTTFTNSEDFIVKLTGLIDLSQASFSNSNDIIALV